MSKFSVGNTELSHPVYKERRLLKVVAKVHHRKAVRFAYLSEVYTYIQATLAPLLQINCQQDQRGAKR